ncbi:MAG TPA: sigma-70 family RNA polymerase sigma factor [Planctomicrobium sp.]|nr:sigma-70 family RNA polymerase sigma factor [Planctomicrobium sp.]
MVSSESDETELRQRLRESPARALSEEFARHRSRLFQIVRFRLDPRLAARLEPDDVLQEAWVAAHARIDSFLDDQELSMFIWLRWIVNQTIVDIHRHHLGTQMRDAYREISADPRDLQRTTAASIAGQLLAQMSSPSQIAVREETARLLKESLESMDTVDREVLALRHFEELTNNEVAAALNITPKAASIRYVRALQRLKKILDFLPEFTDPPDDLKFASG